MNIGIDISQVVYEGTGVGRFTRGLIESILEYDTENKWTFFFSALRGKMDEDLMRKITSSSHRLIHIPLSPPLLSFMWNTLHVIPVETFTGPLDIFISSDWTEPPASCKKATVVHDFAYVRYPETVHETILSTQKKRMEWVRKESDLIITPSKATRDDVLTFFGIAPEKTVPLYSGVTIKKPSHEILEQVKNKFGLGKKFILSVGKVEPRKNISRLIDAFISLDPKEWNLVVVGPDGWDTQSAKKKPANVTFTGFVTEEELHALYELSQFFVYPSLWEGFGYPVIEAMLHAKSVAASNTSSLLELVSGHGVVFDPSSTAEIAQALKKLIEDEVLRKKLEKEGLEFAGGFTWKRYFNELMVALHNCVNS